MSKTIFAVAAVGVGIVTALVCINTQYTEHRFVAPCTNNVVEVTLRFPKARNYHFLLGKPSNGNTVDDAEVSGRITLEGSDGSIHACAFTQATLRKCNWLDDGTNHVDAYVIYLTQPTGTNEVWLKDFLHPGNEYRIRFEFAGLPSTNCSIWLHWVTTLYTRLR